MLLCPQVSENLDLKHIVGCKISKRFCVLVHGYQDFAYGVWFSEGNMNMLTLLEFSFL